MQNNRKTSQTWYYKHLYISRDKFNMSEIAFA